MTNTYEITKRRLEHFLNFGDLVAEPYVAELNYAEYAANYQVREPSDISRIFCGYKVEQQEVFLAIFLNCANCVTSFVEVSRGLVNQCPVAPREVFREAVKNNAVSIIIAHNHPSGNIEASKEDIAITRNLVKAGKLLEITVLDHIILGMGGFTSLLRTNPEIFEEA